MSGQRLGICEIDLDPPRDDEVLVRMAVAGVCHSDNRIENSHQPTRQRERAMKRFTSPGHAQRFLSAFSGISRHFRPGRHRLTAPEWRTEMADRFTVWREVTATVVA